MHSPIYWIDGVARGRLAIMARPRADDWLEDEIAHWWREGVQVVVSLLEAHELTDLGLALEGGLCRDRGMVFLEYPIPDRGVPGTGTGFAAMVATLAQRTRAGDAVAVHCRAGIGRSSLVAGCVMIALGFRAAAALEAIETARGLPVPDTDEQRRWLEAFGAHWAEHPLM
ncbi:MAG: protein-tyrosine phosphatase family protein [Sphingomonadales bacterium]